AVHPLEGVASRDVEAAPVVVALEHVGVVGGEHLGGDGAGHDAAHLVGGRPDVGQVDGVAVAVVAEGVAVQVDVHRARQRVGDHQRRGGQVVHLDVGVD